MKLKIKITEYTAHFSESSRTHVAWLEIQNQPSFIHIGVCNKFNKSSYVYECFYECVGFVRALVFMCLKLFDPIKATLQDCVRKRSYKKERTATDTSVD